MPVHSNIPICTFTFSDNSLLTPQDDSQGQYVCTPLELDHKHRRYGKKSISPILFVVVVVVILVLQFESLYLKNCKRYRSEILYTSRVR